MDVDQLEPYWPHKGHRVAMRNICQKNGPRSSSTTSSKSGSLMAKLKQRLCSNDDGDEPAVKTKRQLVAEHRDTTLLRRHTRFT